MTKEEVAPFWFHPDGKNMRIVMNAPEHPRVRLESSRTGAICVIKQEYPGRVQDPKRFPWKIKCEVPGLNGGGTESKIFCTTAQLLQMFDTDPTVDEAGEAGLFHRQGRFLSLLGKGTGQKGDPHLCLYITDELVGGVTDLVRCYIPH